MLGVNARPPQDIIRLHSAYIAPTWRLHGAFGVTMALHGKELTDGIAKRLPAPDVGFTITICPKSPGFGVRVTAGGSRSCIHERRVDGRNVRRTLAPVEGPSSVGVDAARRMRLDVSAQLDQGRDPLMVKR